MSALTGGTGTITVNVGGSVYTTTLATLTRVEGSMLGALAEALSDGEVLFIDRDGPSFRYVLNYLRDPFAKPLLPRDPTERDQLAREVDFYGLPGLLGGSSTTEAAGGGWKGETACTRVLPQSELYGLQSGNVIYRPRPLNNITYVSTFPNGSRHGEEGPFPRVWKQYPCHDLRGLSLRYMDLRMWNLRGCNLAGVDATGADFTGANLSDANLSGANLQEAMLLTANLTRSKFSGADVRRACFNQNNREVVEREAAPGDYREGHDMIWLPNGQPFNPQSQPATISQSVGALFPAPPSF